MKYIITGKNIDENEGLKSAIESNFDKLDRYFNKETDVVVTLSVEKDRQTMEVTIPVKGSIIRAEQTSTDMYGTLDLVVDVIESQIKKYKTKLKDKHQSGGVFTNEFLDTEFEEEEEVKIVKTKRFGIKPMDPIEACYEMELLGHDFFVFLNAETDDVCVVYKRKGNTYGLIEPELD